jgi:predicted nucleotidyltransferase
MSDIVKKVLLEVLVGSRAYGTADESSDEDRRIVFAVPTAQLLSVTDRGKGLTIWQEAKKDGTENDLTGWELSHYVKLALNCNPTILEVLWAPQLYIGAWGAELRALRWAFLSRQRVYDAFRGYASNQAKKMMWEPGAGIWSVRNWKFAEAYIRALYQGCVLLETGELPIVLNRRPHHWIHAFLVRAKQGTVSKGEVVNLSDTLEQRLNWAYLHSSIPEEADVHNINEFVLRVRQQYWRDE